MRTLLSDFKIGFRDFMCELVTHEQETFTVVTFL